MGSTNQLNKLNTDITNQTLVVHGGAALQQQAPNEISVLGLPSAIQMEALEGFCKKMVGTPFLPRTLVQNRIAEQQSGCLLAVVLTGREMGLLPMNSLRAFWLSPDGRLGMYADAMLGIMRSKEVRFKWLQNDNTGVRVLATRGEEEYEASFTIEDAVTAGLAVKDTWKRYPKAMCRARAISEVFRALCADMGGTQIYSREELQDMETEPDGQGQTVHDMADQAAQADPDLAITRKAETVIDAQPEPKPESASRPPAPEPEPAPEPAHAPAPPPPDEHAEAKATYKKHLNSIRKLIPGLTREKIASWCVAWFNDESATPEAYAMAIGTLHQALEQLPQAKEQLLADAGALGAKMRAAYEENLRTDASAGPDDDNDAKEPDEDDDPIPGTPNSAIAEAFQWSAPTCVLADRVMRAKAKITGDDSAIALALRTFGLQSLTEENAYALLMIYAYYTDAFLLRKRADAKTIPMFKILEAIEQDLKAPLSSFTIGHPDVEIAINRILSTL